MLPAGLAPPTVAAVGIALAAVMAALFLGSPWAEAQGVPAAGLVSPQGFAAGTTGGAGGATYWVTNNDDAGPGSLRQGAESPEPLLIGFRTSGHIALTRHLEVGPNKTIDGWGADVTITGRGFVLARPNVIVANLKFADFGDPANKDSPQDAVLVNGASRVWIDHCTFTRAADKAIGIPEGTDITLSWNRFVGQEQVVQIGAFATRDGGHDARVTMHHNLFDGNGYRMPRVSYGKVHAYDNYLRNWAVHGMSAVRDAQLLSQANIFEAGAKNNAVIFSGGDPEKDASPGFVRSEGDLLLNGAQVKENQPGQVFDPSTFYSVNVEPANETLRQRLLTETGWQAASTGPGGVLAPGPGPSAPDPALGTDGGYEKSSSGAVWALVAGAGVVVVVLVTVVVVHRRRTRRGGPGGGPTAGPPPADVLQPLGR